MASTNVTRTVVLSFFVVLSAVGAARGQTTYYVDDGGSSITCTGWADACPDLQTALGLAISGDQIWVASGTYTPTAGSNRTATFQLITGVAVYGGFDATETTLEERAGLFDETILSGDIGTIGDNSDNSYHVLTGSGTDATAVLDGFTITGGNANGSSPDETGGGMRNVSASPTVTNCTFSGNSAKFAGGMFNQSSSPTVTNCTFSGNSATIYAGGMYNWGHSSPTVTNCTFRGNSAASYGGGMFNEYSPTVTNCTFSGNSASSGGGMYNYYQYSSPTVTNCTFSGNSATYYGGGMYNDGSSPTVTNCILWGDTAPTGPEIYDSSSTPTVTYSDVQGGYAGTGNVDLDPLFVNAAAGDLRLGGLSPCVDTGNNAAVALPTDLDGNPRIIDGDLNGTPTVDMGAYEFSPPVYVDAQAAAGAQDGSSWCDAFLNPQDALAIAWAGMTIRVADGTYKPTTGTDRASTFQLISGVRILGGYAGCGAADPDEREVGLYETILSGDLNGNDTAVSCTQHSPDCDSYGRLCVAGHCIIKQNNAENSYHVVTGSGTDATAVLDGFTITGGSANGSNPHDLGGGMYNSAGSPTVTHCTFTRNTAGNGGGMYNRYGASPAVTNCAFTDNAANAAGGGMYNYSDANPTVTNCTFSSNWGEWYGGGMHNDHSGPTVTNCTFSNNLIGAAGCGMRNNFSSYPTVTNCIFWGHAGCEISDYDSTPTITYSNVHGGYPGAGNIDADPLFADLDGRLSAGSPCIDAGDDTAVTVTFDLDGNPRIMDGDGDTTLTVDMGAYEYYPDCNENSIPDMCDLDCTALGGACDVPGCGGSDDCNVNGIPDECDVQDPVFADFQSGDTPSYHLNGSASLLDGAIRLVPPAVSQLGSIVFDEISDYPTTQFAASFDFMIGDGGGVYCGDGMSFALLDISTYSTSELWDEHGPISSSLAVEFDIYQNTGEPNHNHLGLWLNGVLLAQYTPTFDLNNEAWHHALVELREGAITVVLDPQDGPPETAFNAVPVPGYTPFVALWGFAARTGGLYEEHWVDNVYFASGRTSDCNDNGVPDDCDLDSTDPDGNGEVSGDCNENGIADECDLQDCNANDVPDECEIPVSSGGLCTVDCDPDCNENGIPDACDIDPGDPDGNGDVSDDCNQNSVPDDCETLPAGTIYVDDSAVAGLNDGSGWTDALSELSFAMCLARSTGAVTEIRVAQGTYRPTVGIDRAATFQLVSGVSVVGGYAGYGAADPDERNFGLYETILSGDIGALGDNSDNSYHVVTGSGTDATAVLDGFTITGGNANGSYPDYVGGGMYNHPGSPTVTNCTFTGNWAFGCAGMITVSSSPIVTNCTFSGNSGAAASGGGMCNYWSSPTVTNCTFSGNSAVGGGGGMDNFNSSPTVTNCTFSGNSATYYGGGMYNENSSPTVTNCILWGDTAPTDPEIYNVGSTPTVTYSDVQGSTGEPWCGTGCMDEDPLFVDADGPDDVVGTDDDDLRLSLASHCFEAGDDSALPADTADLDGDGDTAEPIPFDLDGNPRCFDADGDTIATVDLGAYELPHRLPQEVLEPCPNDFAETDGGAGGERLSRFGCFSAPAPPAAAGGVGTAIRVKFRTLYNTTGGDPDGASVCTDRSLLTTPLPSLSQFETRTRWLAAPAEIVDEATPAPPNYIAAPLVCTAEEAAVRDWSPAGLAAEFGGDADPTRIYFYDYALVPCSVYEVSHCSDPLNESTCSEPLLIFTSRMADAWPPFDAAGQPSFTDINALVNKFKGIPFTPGATPQGGAPEWHSLQKGNVVGDYDVTVANRKVGFLDIGVSVDGFKGIPYREEGPCDPGTGLDNCGSSCTP